MRRLALAVMLIGLIGDPERDPMAITREAESPALRRAWALTERYLTGARLGALGRREGFPVINLLPIFRARTSDGPLFRRDDIHHTPAGAALFADGITAGLGSLGLLPGCGRS